MSKVFVGVLFLIIISQSTRANYLDRAAAKLALKSAVHVITNYPIIISAVVLFLFRHEIFSLLKEHGANIVGEYPIASFFIGLVGVKVGLNVIGSSS